MARMVRRLLACILLLGLVGFDGVGVRAAADFAAPVFRFQWESAEANSPNFFGPLANASLGFQETYKEASGGTRLVQYFDKARMELAGPNTVTNGLLTVELKTGKMQTGDNTFEQRVPAVIGLAGDPGQAGPTYADLAKLPERSIQAQGTVLTTTFKDSTFGPSSVVPTDPALALVQYTTDPGGRYGQYIPKAFWDYLNALPLPWQGVMGFPISPAFGTQLVVNGAARPVFIQAFERRVLTYTPGNPPGFTVEFGNIGQHYYTWRYGNGITPSPPAAAPVPPPPVASAPAPNAALITGADPIFQNAITALVARTSGVLPFGAAVNQAGDETMTYQPFESGYMLYVKDSQTIYVLGNNGVQLLVYQNSWNDGDPNGDLGPGPRAGTYVPKRGFGKVWRENAVVQKAVGYALTDEQPYTGKIQFFERGILVTDSTGGTVYALGVIAGVWDKAPK